ncbi:hypothetical protein EpCFBP13511_05240 [Erwinia persicina]|uniref:Uncharacterized protein n=1 Tax=Erwinia persicina TaxID=55211 RepID=A0A4U3FGN5_9GAMM|nr:hypothetical protein EpCFBP13511_05240 [Erwinia persicina]
MLWGGINHMFRTTQADAEKIERSSWLNLVIFAAAAHPVAKSPLSGCPISKFIKQRFVFIGFRVHFMA